ncbi:hypothetical protein [Prevotella sp. 885]|uniref:hypothetical protein n=1 Tax=Prevotella sp. 885 TaxID=2022527 RepID=UPI0015961D9B|nr:hypothetical protein [Prevotella sp. 885]
MNYSRQGKHRRLWRLAVATQPTIAGTRGTRNSILNLLAFVGAWLRRDAIAS